MSSTLLLFTVACYCIIANGILAAIESSSFSSSVFPVADCSPSFGTRSTQRNGPPPENSYAAFSFSLRSRKKQQRAKTNERNAIDSTIAVCGHHQRRIDDNKRHLICRYHSDSDEYDIQCTIEDISDIGQPYQQQEQKKPQEQEGKQNHLTPTIHVSEKECFHSTFVCAKSPNPRLNGKPSISRTTAHEQEDNTLDFTSCNSTALTPKNVLSDPDYHTREEGISAATSNSGRSTAIDSRAEDTDVDGEETLWAKRNARSIDEGIRFKSQLRQGLEEQTKLHQAKLRREQLLGNLLEGVISGGNSNTSSALLGDQSSNTKNVISNRVRWRGYWNKGDGLESNARSQKKASKGDTYKETHNFNTAIHTSTPDEKVKRNNFGARTIAGLISALAKDPPQDLEVLVDADPSTPSRRKTVRSIKLYFTRLNFMQLRMGPLEDDTFLKDKPSMTKATEKFELAKSFFKFGKYKPPQTADEAFDAIDLDNSGALDEEELAQALKTAAVVGGNNKIWSRSEESLKTLAKRMIKLYDMNGDGAVDREEYRGMVADFSSLREARLDEEKRMVQMSKIDQKENGTEQGKEREKKWGRYFSSIFGDGNLDDISSSSDNNSSVISKDDGSTTADGKNNIKSTERAELWEAMDQGEGSLVLEDLELDLRRLVFGAIPAVKRVAPGGPLILKPFTATLTCSFNADDIMSSILLDTGLRRLVARALSRRVTSLRDLLDGAVFYGRTWKQFQQSAPKVVVDKLEDVRFDKRNRLIITGRARIMEALGIRHEPIEQGFKLRTKIGTRAGGRIIGLLQPEIAIFAEFPKGMEESIRRLCKDCFGYTMPTFKPLYAYIPLVSPLKKDDKIDGFNMGEDNQIKSIDIKNGKVRLSYCAFLRPGRFLGNHYLAFTFPNRTLIFTLDRLREMVRNARRNRRLAKVAAREVQQLSNSEMGPHKENINDVTKSSDSGKSLSISPEGKVRLRQLGTQVEKELKVPFFEDAILRAMKEDVESKNSEKKRGKSFISRFVEGFSGAFREELDMELNARLSTSISDFFGSQDREDVEEYTNDKNL